MTSIHALVEARHSGTTELVAANSPTDHLTLPLDGETALAAPIGDDLVLICGVAASMSSPAPVLLNGDPTLAMTATVATWRRHGAPPEAAIGFVAIVPLKIAGRLRLRSIVLRCDGQPVRYTLVKRAVPLTKLMPILSQDAGEHIADVADTMAQALMKGRSNTARVAAAMSLLAATARNDGYVEVMGPADSGEIFLQGWSNALPVDQSRVFVAHDGYHAAELTAATVARDDLGGGAQGFVGLLAAADVPFDIERLKHLFFRTAEGWRTLEIYQRRVLLASTDVPAHIRDVLPRASAGTETLQLLRRAGERFDGRDTVSLLDKPIRLGMDLVVDVPGGGLLVSGWMLDPEGSVDSVILRASGGGAPVHASWTRLPRPDVTAAFEQNDLFAGCIDPRRHDHGFLAFVPGLSSADDEPVYFELSVESNALAFYPLKPVRALSRRALERLVSTLDPRMSGGVKAIERHIGPMMQALDHPAPRIVEMRDFEFDDSASRTALVMGAGLDTEEVSVALSLLALDPEVADMPIVVCVPIATFGDIASEVQRLSAFYGLSVRLIAADGVQDACDAFEAAIGGTKAETLVLLESGVLPRQPGWVARMQRAYNARGGKVLISPTIVFEDDSIRFAGTWLDDTERLLVDRFIGYPRDVVRGAEAMEVIAGTTACCIVSRAALASTGGFGRTYLGVAEKGRDLCLKLKLAGIPSLWLPEVEMVAADEDHGGSGLAWRRLAQRIDRWSFNRRWSLLVANMRG
ncbi:glycosyltransferase family 2 protein [Microvirga brassicacearum]|uniref:glycosyltransferase family 2 protein n=1 Tax=Microvirga brassicacearum TaxID=2580413 RepID=UPI001FCEF4BE|nr:hypothetical protein [Microvirga brassicacearum]